MEHFQFGIREYFTWGMWQSCLFSVTEDIVPCFEWFNYAWNQDCRTSAQYPARPTVWLGVLRCWLSSMARCTNNQWSFKTTVPYGGKTLTAACCRGQCPQDDVLCACLCMHCHLPGIQCHQLEKGCLMTLTCFWIYKLLHQMSSQKAVFEKQQMTWYQ